MHLKDQDGNTALHRAARHDQDDGQGRTPLMIAAEEGKTNVLGVLIENKADVHLKKQDGYTALHTAAWNDRAEAAQVLLAHSSKVDDVDSQRRTPLMIAAEKGNTNVLEVLIENKANVQLKEKDGLTALHMATWNGQARAAMMLLANGSIVDDTCDQGRTPLMIATEKGKTNVLKLLLENKADVRLKEQCGLVALHMAAWNDQPEAAQMLLACGSKVDDADGQGQTPLMIAAARGNTDVLEVLIDNRADVHLKEKMASLYYTQQPGVIKLQWPRCYLLMAVKWMIPMARDGLH